MRNATRHRNGNGRATNAASVRRIECGDNISGESVVSRTDSPQVTRRQRKKISSSSWPNPRSVNLATAERIGLSPSPP